MNNIKEISIVAAVLAMVVFTGVTAASGSQRFNVKCTDNLRNLRRAAQQYENDHDGVIPPVVQSVKHHALFWPNRLLRYIGSNTQIFYCPQDEKKGAKMLDVPDLLPIAYSLKSVSYGMNYFLGDVGKARPNMKTGEYRIDKITDPAYVIYFGDAKFVRLRPTKVCWKEDYAPRHNNGSNFVFVDGHVEWMDHNTLGLLGVQSGEPEWKIDRKRWNPWLKDKNKNKNKK